ncbi:MAG TPA: sulfite exporter TauE/SafE family protein [Actinomycetales bacterium]|nr:sulfite exporter TauE/SafE family protein [Actinomycetales bacterium]
MSGLAFGLTIGLAVVVGLSLGLLGGGGSILTVPLLAYVAGMPAKEAITTSLVVVGTTSAAAVVTHARAGRVQWRTGLVFGAAGMAAAYAGGRLSGFLPGTVLLVAFAVVMLLAGVAMLRGRRPVDPTRVRDEMPLLRTVAQGAGVGLVTGVLGAGGGFLIVPALALLGGLPMPIAVATSLVVITMNSAAGLAGHLSSTHVNWGLAAAVTASAVLGSIIGGRLVSRIAPEQLRKAFGWFVLLMAAVVLAQEVALVVGAVAAAAVAFAAVVSFARGRTRERLGASMSG